MNNDKNQPIQLGENIIIRPYKKSDFEFVEQLQATVFGPARFTRAAYRVREKFPIEENLSLIAQIGGKNIGYVAMTPISINRINGYLLGPLVIDIGYRGLGIGKKLVQQVCAKAFGKNINSNIKKEGDLTAKFIILVGDLPYYQSLGFKPTKPNMIKMPGPVNPDRLLIYWKDADLSNILKGELAAKI